jgi:hypothetical protein
MRRVQLFGIGLLGFAIGSAGRAESVKDFWTKRPPIASYASSKSALALEYCLGMAGSEDGMPNVLRGDGITLVSITVPGSIISTIMGFRISDTGERRTIDVLGRGSALGTWERHSRQYAESCV